MLPVACRVGLSGEHIWYIYLSVVKYYFEVSASFRLEYVDSAYVYDFTLFLGGGG